MLFLMCWHSLFVCIFLSTSYIIFRNSKLYSSLHIICFFFFASCITLNLNSYHTSSLCYVYMTHKACPLFNTILSLWISHYCFNVSYCHHSVALEYCNLHTHTHTCVCIHMWIEEWKLPMHTRTNRRTLQHMWIFICWLNLKVHSC